jgi:uncharacterized protein (TIGR00290 family)
MLVFPPFNGYSSMKDIESMERVQMPKAILSWSGGKDSALALHEVRKAGDYKIRALLTTITEAYDRSSMHGIRRPLMEQQAESLGLSLEEVLLSPVSSNEEYDARMREILERYKAEGVSAVVFGDIFLEDVRKYREERLASVGMKGIFPLWGRDTTELARTFTQLGFKAVITCVDTEQMDSGYAGRAFDEEMLASLPAGVDPCGENGEFHSFVYDGPIFTRAIPHTTGEVVLRDERFMFADLIPAK